MITHLLRTFRQLFITRTDRAAVGGLIVLMAAVPVAEMLVLRLFSSLVIDAPGMLNEDPGEAVVSITVFFLAFAVTRGLHHLARLARVKAFRRGFEVGDRARTPSQESWEWALAFELSSVLTSLVQVATFSVLFVMLDWPTGVLSIAVSLGVLAIVSWLFRRQLELQRGYARMGSRAGTTAIAERVGTRIRDAEVGSLLASIGLVVVLAFVLVRTLRGEMASADAIVLFLATRLLYGQLGQSSAAMMRFARAAARREV